MRALAGIVSLGLIAACGRGSQGTPAGPVGQPDDLRKHLKPEVAAKAPTDDKATRYEYAMDLHGVKAKVVWRAFENGGNKYLLSVGWEVVTPANAITIEPRGMGNPVNAGTETAVIESLPVMVRWRDTGATGESFGDQSVSISADGSAR